MSDLLEGVLLDAQRRGYLGVGEIAGYVHHAQGYLDGPAVEGTMAADRILIADGSTCVDLGSGSGIPGLILALARPATRWHLVERSGARADWLRRAVVRLAIDDRVVVRHEPAEKTGRGPLRAACDIVVARLFAAPAVAAECAAPLLVAGGVALLSDTRGPVRWDDDALGELGLERVATWENAAGAFVALEQRQPCPDRFPRSPGVPARRPLF